jgi:nucleotide-binding universal stress UspA family protein
MKAPGWKREIALSKVLFATDFSPASDAGLAYAATIADRYHSELYIAHVLGLGPFGLIDPGPTPAMILEAHEQARQKIERLVEARGLPSDHCHPVVAEGRTPEVLLELLVRDNIDMAILGTHGHRALKKLWLGSVAEEVFRGAPCPVLTVGPKVHSSPGQVAIKHILYPLESVPDSSLAAEYAVSLAEQYAATLSVMNVREDMPLSANKEEKITEAGRHWIEDHVSKGSELRGRLRFERGFGPAGKAILDFATKTAVDLIVIFVCPADPDLAAHLPGPDTAYEVAGAAPCPVLTVRG